MARAILVDKIYTVEKSNGHADMPSLPNFDFLSKKYLPAMRL
jgi:hypothetical protein